MSGHYIVAVAMVIMRDSKVLIGKRSPDKDVGAGIWEFPSGRLEDRESPEEAVRREGREELGTDVVPISPIHSYFFMRGDEPCILIAYLSEMKGEATLSEEHSELRWVPLESLDEYITLPKLREIGEKLKKLVTSWKRGHMFSPGCL